MKPSNWIEQLNRVFWTNEKANPLQDADHFARVYEETHLSIYRYIYGLTGGPSTQAEDLTAETYLRAWKNRLSYHGRPADAIGWLIRLARNLVIDEYRKTTSRPAIHDRPPDEDLPEAEYRSPETQALLNEQQEIMLALLQTLPAEAREMLVLRYLLDWQINRIAHHLEMQPNTVSVSIRRALEKVKQAWPNESERK